MSQIAEHSILELESGQTAGWTARQDGELTLQEGRLWITRPGDPRDYWIRQGERFAVRAGERLFLGAEKAKALALVRFCGTAVAS